MARVKNGLEGKQAQDQIHGSPDFLDATRAPGPDRGADVMHRGYARLAYFLFEPEIEIRGIDADQHVGTFGQQAIMKFAANTQQAR